MRSPPERGLDRNRVLQEGRLLADNQIVNQVRAAGITAYEKDPFYKAQKKKILRLTQDPVAFANLPTKTRPQVVWPKSVIIRIPGPRIQARYITIDDIDSFGRVARIRVEPGEYTEMAESRFKNGIAKILGEGGKFKDWGGERNDLYTNRVRISGRRLPAAFAFKGVGTRGILTPRFMGKNGGARSSDSSKQLHTFSLFSIGGKWPNLLSSKWRSSRKLSLQPRVRLFFTE